jgi:hypothetical protein
MATTTADNDNAARREIKIGHTTYRLTRKYEGRKTIDEILKNLAVRQAAKQAEAKG